MKNLRVGRGYFTEETLRRIHEKMCADLASYGTRLDGIYYCPHHPQDNCECRKPKTVMFKRAANDLDIDLSRSFTVGDMALAIEAGAGVECQTVLITGNPWVTHGWHVQPSHIATGLAEAVDWILREVTAGARGFEPPTT